VSQVEIDHLNKFYTVGEERITAVQDVSIRIEKGDFVSIVGHSGSGKTTLISLIGGLIHPTSGRIFFDGTDICTFNEDRLCEYRNRKIGFMFQFASLLPVLTAKENVLLPGIFDGGTTPEGEKRAEAYLDIMGIGNKKNVYPAQLSGGQQRRVAIARALMNNPELILADEPTGDLDEETEAEVIEVFQRINNKLGLTFVIATHSAGLVRECNRHFRMKQGILTEEIFPNEQEKRFRLASSDYYSI